MKAKLGPAFGVGDIHPGIIVYKETLPKKIVNKSSRIVGVYDL